MTNDSNNDNELFKTFLKDVKPLKKNNKISNIKEKKDAIIAKKPKTLQHENVHNNLNKELYSTEKKLKPYQSFRPGISIHYEELPEKITSESILSYGLDRLSQAHQDKVRKGQIELHSKIDLHGLDRIEAQDRLQRFLHHAKAHGLRNVLVIHGKGSQHGETPILKQHLFLYLRQYNYLLAMHSAHAKHGGTGALYVLLKKQAE